MKKQHYFEFIKWKNKIKKNDLFLDVGCWDGSNVLEMNKRCNAYGVDFNPKTLGLADSKIADKLSYSDITKKIDVDKKFDWVLCSEVIEHIKEDKKALENIAGVMKKGGKLVLTTPRSVKFFEFWDPAWVRWKFGGKERHWHYKLEELRMKLDEAGFRILVYSIRGNVKWVIGRWVNVILKYLIGVKFQFNGKWGDGFSDFMILAERI
jgi:SAM-dependent methyltransferase